MSNFTIQPTTTAQIFKKDKNGIAQSKVLPYVISCQVGGKNLLTLNLREFNKDGKQGKLFATFEINWSYAVSFLLMEQPNSKGFLTNDGIAVANLSEIVLTDYLSNKKRIIATQGLRYEQTHLLFKALVPLFSEDVSGKLDKTGYKRILSKLDEKNVLFIWSGLDYTSDVIYNSVVDHAKEFLSNLESESESQENPDDKAEYDSETEQDSVNDTQETETKLDPKTKADYESLLKDLGITFNNNANLDTLTALYNAANNKELVTA